MADGPVGARAAQELNGPAAASAAGREAAAGVVIAAGVAAALHVAKLPPAIPALQQALGLSLVEAGFLLSMVQLAGMGAGLAVGTLADGLGLRRSMLIGLAVLALASAAGTLAAAPLALMLLRAVEGFGFLLVVLPAPGLVRGLVPPARLARAMGLWSTYMPVATALALLFGPLAVEALGWRGWWWGLALLTLGTAVAVHRAVPVLPRPPAVAAGTLQRLRDTLAAPGPWLLGLCFACYALQWMAVVGFLPTLVREAGADAALTGVLTAGVACINIVGNVGAGRLLHRGWSGPRLLATGFGSMGLCALLAFADLGQGLAVRYGAVLLLTGLGGLVPATLFALVVRLAPAEHLMSATVGWMQQGSAFGQFAGPPAVAWLASRVGGWHLTWAVTGAAALAGLAMSRAIARRLSR